MKYPDGKMLKCTYSTYITTTTDGSDSGKLTWVSHCQVPGAISTHTQASKIDTVGIYVICANGLIKRSTESIARPPLSGRALRRDNNKREICFMFQYLWQPLKSDLLYIATALTRAM